MNANKIIPNATTKEAAPILIETVSDMPYHSTASVAPPNPAYSASVIP